MTKEEKIKAAATKYIKTLPAINYRSVYNFGTQNIAAFYAGATSEASREYWQGDVIEFVDWIVNNNYKNHPRRKLWYFDNRADLDIPTYMTTSELYQLFKDQNNLNNIMK